jgi:hypothetical protein
VFPSSGIPPRNPVWEKLPQPKEEAQLGFKKNRLLLNGKLGIAPKSIERAKEKIRRIAGRNRRVSLEQVMVELNRFVVGWIAYYRNAACRADLLRLDEWLRRKLRCLRLEQRKRAVPGKPAGQFRQGPMAFGP